MTSGVTACRERNAMLVAGFLLMENLKGDSL
jgi:hypothetical protein